MYWKAARYIVLILGGEGGLEHLEHLEHSWIRFETAGSSIFGIYILLYFLEEKLLERYLSYLT
jgi:hypothetical protein